MRSIGKDGLGAIPRITRKARTIAAQLTSEARISWPPDWRVVSFTFDDFPVSAGQTGARVLESFGLRATYYTSLGRLGGDSVSGPLASLETVRRLAHGGHELGCHTYSHLDCSRTDEVQIDADCERNRTFARQYVQQDLVSFAYPFGGINRAARRLICRRYSTARTVWPGINRRQMDLAALRAVSLSGANTGIERALRYLDNVWNAGGWLVFYTHDVGDSPSEFGCSEISLRYVCEYALALGLDVVPVREVARRLTLA